MQLAAFTRVTLRPGESKEVSFEIDPRQLSLVLPDGTRSVLAGDYGIALDPGTSTTPPEITKHFHIRGTSVLPQ